MKDLNQEITIRPFQPEDQEQVQKLILTGLAEHWGSLDPGKNPDLQDIGKTYAGGVFLVACKQERMIGTGALVARGKETGEIVRMSVAKDLRRRGLGSRILERLIQEAKTFGMRQLVLETTETWREAIAFYKSAGFKETHRKDGDVYFRLEV